MLHSKGAICIWQQPWATQVACLAIPPAPGDETRTTKTEQAAKLSLGLKRFLLLPQVCSWWEGETPLGPQSWRGHPVRPDFQTFPEQFDQSLPLSLCCLPPVTCSAFSAVVSVYPNSPYLWGFFFPFGVSKTQKFRPSWPSVLVLVV